MHASAANARGELSMRGVMESCAANAMGKHTHSRHAPLMPGVSAANARSKHTQQAAYGWTHAGMRWSHADMRR